jgi:hypothetical protein
MRKLKLSEEELVGLLGLLFWNDSKFLFCIMIFILIKRYLLALTNLEAQEAQIVVSTQRKIVSELYTVCRTQTTSNLDASIRFGIL